MLTRPASLFWIGALAATLAGCYGSSRDAPSAWIVGGPGRGPGEFYKPRALVESEGRIYVVDMSGRIQALDLDGAHLATWRLPQIHRGFPTGLAAGPGGVIAVADTHNYVVRIYNREGEELRAIGREGGGAGEFTYLTDVAFDASGNMYVSEHGREDRVQKFDPAGEFLLAWGKAGEAAGEFHRPQALAVNDDDMVYVADAANHRVQVFAADGQFVREFGSAGDASGELLYPYDLAIGPGGVIFVCEYGNNRVQAFDAEGRSLGTWGRAGNGVGELHSPWGVIWLEGVGIMVVERDSHRLQVFPIEAKTLVGATASGGNGEAR